MDRRFFNYSVFVKPRRGILDNPFDYFTSFERRKALINKVIKEHLETSEVIKKNQIIEEKYRESSINRPKPKT
jgi:hypothetical protein